VKRRPGGKEILRKRTWGLGERKLVERKREVGSSLLFMFIVEKGRQPNSYPSAPFFWTIENFKGYFKYLVIRCL